MSNSTFQWRACEPVMAAAAACCESTNKWRREPYNANSWIVYSSSHLSYRVDSCEFFVRLSSVLNDRLEMRQAASDAEYLLQLLVVLDNNDVTTSVVGHVVTGVGWVGGVDAGRITTEAKWTKYQNQVTPRTRVKLFLRYLLFAQCWHNRWFAQQSSCGTACRYSSQDRYNSSTVLSSIESSIADMQFNWWLENTTLVVLLHNIVT